MTASTVNTGTSKPTASVLPVRQDSQHTTSNAEPESPMEVDDASCSNNSSQLTLDDTTESDSQPDSGIKQSSFLTSTAATTVTTETVDSVNNKHDTDGSSSSSSNNQTLLNGNVAPHMPRATSPDSLPNGPSTSAKPNGPVSLLSGNLSPTSVYPAAASEVLKPNDLLKLDSLLIKGRNDPSSSVVKTGASHTNKNIVISSLNKQTGAIGTKVVTATTHTGKVGN